MFNDLQKLCLSLQTLNQELTYNINLPKKTNTANKTSKKINKHLTLKMLRYSS